MAALTVIPLTAMLHHLVFYRYTCMLHAFGADYSPSVIVRWLSGDPSLDLAIAAMIVLYLAGNAAEWLKILVAPAFASFLPLSAWIWDIPFTGRVLYSHFHDDRVMLVDGVPLRSRYFYLMGVVCYLVCVAYLFQKRRMARCRATSAAVSHREAAG